MAKETPNQSLAYCNYLCTNPLGANTPTQRPFGRIATQAGVREVFEIQPDSGSDPDDFVNLYLVRLVEQITDEEAALFGSGSPDLNLEPTQQPLYQATGTEQLLGVPSVIMVRAYAFFRDHTLTDGPVAPGFVRDNPNEWVVMVQTFNAIDPETRTNWSLRVAHVEVAGNKVGGGGSMPEIAAPFIQAP